MFGVKQTITSYCFTLLSKMHMAPLFLVLLLSYALWRKLCRFTWIINHQTTKSRIIARELKVEWQHLKFRTILERFERKNNLGGLRTIQKGKQRNKLIVPDNHDILPRGVSHEKRKESLTLDNFSLSSQQLVPNYFLYPSKISSVHLREFLAQFWPNKHCFPTGRHFLCLNI